VTARRLSGHSIHPFTSSSPSTSYLRGSPSGMTQGPSPTLAPRPAIAHSSSIGRTSSFLSQSGRSFTHAQLANMHPSSASPPVTGAMSREHLPLGSSPNAAQPTSPSSLSFSKQPLPRSLSGRPPYTAQGSSPFIPGSFERDSTMPVSGQPHQVVRKYSSTLGQGQRARVSSYGSSGGEGSSVPTTGNQNLLRRSSTRMSTESGLRHSLETPDPAAINVPDDDDIQSFLKTLDSLPQPPSLAAQAATSRARQPSASSSLSNTSLRQANSPQPSNSPSPLPTGAGALAARTPVTRAQVDDAVRRMTGSFATHAKSLEQSRIMPPLSPDEISPRFDPSPSNRSSSGTTSVGLLTASRPLPASRRVSPSALHGPTDSSSPPTGRSASVKKNSPLSGEPLQPPTPGPPYRPGPDPRAVQTALPSSPPPVSAATQAKAAARSLPIGQAPLAEDSPVPVRAGHPTSGFLSPQPTGSSKRDTSATNQSQRRGPVLLRGGFDGRSQSPSQSKAGQRQSVSPSRSPIRDFSRLAVAAGPSRIPASISAGGGVGAVGGGEHHAEAELNGWRRYRSEQRIQMAGTTNAAPGQQGTGVRRQSVGTANVLESAATGAERVTGSAGAGAEGAQGQRTAPSSLGRYRDKGSGGDE
jgi:autophagy-related protein 13